MRGIPALTVLGVVTCLATPRASQAEPWHHGAAGKRRITHLAFAAGGGALYAISETVAKPGLAPDRCRWCSVGSLDDNVRDALVWDDPKRAVTLSNVTGFALAPVLLLGMTGLAASSAAPAGEATGRVLDDVIPLVETAVYSALVVQVVKFAAGRERPLVHYNTEVNRAPSDDDNLSWFSGHATLTFGLAVSAGVVAHRRGSKLEPVIWATGLSVAAATSYLRIAGDKHFLTDVLAGAAFGTAAGLLVPRITHSLPAGVDVVPTGNGVAVLGAF